MGCYWNIGSWIDLTIINPTTYTGWADVVSTTSDLITFIQALRNGTIINSSSLTLMNTEYPGTLDYGLGYDLYTYNGVSYNGHYGEVANTSALFFANTTSTRAPNGYYISYNFNVQGVDDINEIAMPIFTYLNSNETNGITSLGEIKNTTHVFPNPATSQLTIKTDSKSNETQTLFLTDELGKTVLEQSFNNFSSLSVDCSPFKRGIYTLSIQSDSKIEYHKIILH
jgi:hypothetical protein